MKGYFYSASVLLIIVPLIGLVVFMAMSAGQATPFAVSKAVTLQHARLIQSLQFDFDRALLISTRAALLSCTQRVVLDGQYLSDARQSVRTLVVDGVFPNETDRYPTTENSYLAGWADRMEAYAANFGLNLSLNVTPSQVSVEPVSATRLRVAANLSIRASPISTLFAFNLTRTYLAHVDVDVLGYEDPLYSLGAKGRIARTIQLNQSPVSGVAAVDGAVESGVYWPSALGPGYLQRLEGNLSADVFGLESIVDVNDLTAQELATHNGSALDWQYFNTTLPRPDAFPVNLSTKANLRLDCPTAARLGVNLTTPC